jgi:class 3 adenylate cyclase
VSATNGTVTIVMVEGRRMMRLSDKLTPEVFGALLDEYQRLLRDVLEREGGRAVEVAGDTATAVFVSARQAALAAAAAQRAVAAHAWPHRLRAAVSVALDSVEGDLGSVGSATARCSDLCDAAEGGQIFVSRETARLLQDEDLGELLLRNLGERQTRRTQRPVGAYELVVPSDAPSN